MDSHSAMAAAVDDHNTVRKHAFRRKLSTALNQIKCSINKQQSKETEREQQQ